MPWLTSGKQIVFAITSLGVTVGIFTYLFHSVSLREVIQIIKEVNRNALAIFVLLSFSQSFFRTWRYQVLLKLSGYKPGNIALFLVVLIRNFFSDLLPARLGSLVYIFMINKRLGIPMGPATSSFAVAFLFDMLALAPLIILASWAAAAKSQISMLPFILGGVLLGAAVLFLIYILPKLIGEFARLFGKIQWVKASWRTEIQNVLSSTGKEIVKAKDSGLYGPVMVLSILVRLTKYGALYVFLYALLQPIGYTLENLYIPEIFLGISASEVAASLPVSGIAAFGAYEGTWAVIFSILGFPEQIAKLTAISHHLFTQVYGYSLGAFAFLVILLPFFKTIKWDKPRKYPQERRIPFYAKTCVTLLCLMVMIFGIAKLPFAESEEVLIAKADRPTKGDRKKRENLAKHFPGKILFDSNRSGTFGIYTIRVDGTGLRKLIDDPKWHEMFPDASPDGKYVVYSRAKTTSRLAPSEVWMIQRDGKNPRRLASDGTFPTFSGNGQTIYFERRRKKVMEVDVNGNDEREIFPAENEKFRRYQVVKPRVSPDGSIVTFTSDRPRAWTAWYALTANSQAFKIRRGCEPVPFGDAKRIAWIYNNHKRIKERSGIYVYNLKDGSDKILQDADAPRGHEYFPTLASNDRYLLYGASRPKEHSHETGNYQIFVKDLQTGKVIRVTFDAYTNRWPKRLPHP